MLQSLQVFRLIEPSFTSNDDISSVSSGRYYLSALSSNINHYTKQKQMNCPDVRQCRAKAGLSDDMWDKPRSPRADLRVLPRAEMSRNKLEPLTTLELILYLELKIFSRVLMFVCFYCGKYFSSTAENERRFSFLVAANF